MASKTIDIIKAIGERFGQQAVRICNAYHVQVKEGGRTHNVWFAKHGLKWQLDGDQHSHTGSAETLLDRLGCIQQYKTDVQSMRSALEMCEMVGNAARRLSEANLSRAVFCDAGMKNGKARIGVLLVDGGSIHAIRRDIEANTIDQAERHAVSVGVALADTVDQSLIVYTDNKSVAEGYGSPRVQWIPRQKNKLADGIANLRK